ncbi:type I signal peptidase [Carnobacterium sp. 17-4]|uniref:signal peptidase I n=1 Tax=Carnobacterium sp. (strain 17-4) TaxID=208596 RepID=UPI0002058F98|nr:signal peptidase I [Carnobacterium sp. 17-4]AEB30256.1 type I signal peptidase [Carnobacterium sp. 17-4]
MKIVKTIGTFIAVIVVFIFVAIAGISFFSAPESSGLFGYKGYTVVSGSMEPKIAVGDFIIVKMDPFDNVNKKDIITFQYNQELVTHRVVDRTADGLVTKGDANNIQDQGFVIAESYIGTQKILIPYFGYVITFLQKPIAFAVIIALMGIYLIYLYLNPTTKDEIVE